MYKLTDVKKIYHNGRQAVGALQGVDLTITDGEWLAVQGPTGHGKTTLLQMLGGLDRPTLARSSSRQGPRRAEGDPGLRHQGESFGFIFQTFNLIPTLSAQENVETALVPLGIGAVERAAWPAGPSPTSGSLTGRGTCPRSSPAGSSSG